MKISYVHLYSSSLLTSSLIRGVSEYLHELFPIVKIDIRSFSYYFEKSMIEEDVVDNRMVLLSHDFLNTAHQHELQNKSNDNGQKITVIDGFYLQRIYSKIIDENETQLDHLHIIFEDNLICTYDENDQRYHARPLICGSPSIISIAGIVEGPAKPKGYYFKLMLKDLISINSKEVENEFANRFIGYDDPRLVQAATGYAIQSIFFFLLMVTHSVRIILVDCLILIGRKNYFILK
jgi:Probable metallopeptidase family (DUF6775)